jgi:hypothetical protein
MAGFMPQSTEQPSSSPHRQNLIDLIADALTGCSTIHSLCQQFVVLGMFLPSGVKVASPAARKSRSPKPAHARQGGVSRQIRDLTSNQGDETALLFNTTYCLSEVVGC